MNTKQHAAEDENFPSLLSELSKQESAGGQMFSLTKGGGRERERGGGGARGAKRQVTTHPTASEERTSTLSQGEK